LFRCANADLGQRVFAEDTTFDPSRARDVGYAKCRTRHFWGINGHRALRLHLKLAENALRPSRGRPMCRGGAMDRNTQGVIIALIIVTVIFAAGYWGVFLR
jgi:hypothetical protein